MSPALRLLVLWLLMLLCMMLHFNYHVSDLFYGIDIVSKTADGTRPYSLIVLRTLFNFLPMLFIVLLMYTSGAWLRWTMLVLSALYALAHLSHLFGTLRSEAPDPSQLLLLALTLALALLQTLTAWRWTRAPSAAG